MPEGIDIYSRYQTVTDWSAVRRADVTWCYQKLSDGMTTRLPQANTNYAGVLQGGYHFSQPGSPVEQAKVLLSQCEKYGLLDLNPCLDMEDNPPGSGKANIRPEQKADYVIAFGRWILSRGHGFTLYANNSDWSFFGPKVMQALPQTFRWVARYGANPTVGWDAHQYTSSGSCPGIRTGSLDRNRGKVPLNKKDIDMPLTEADAKLVAKHVWYDWIVSWNSGKEGMHPAGMIDAMFKADATQTALLKAIEAATNDENITVDEMKAIVNEAVTNKLNFEIVGSVDIKATGS